MKLIRFGLPGAEKPGLLDQGKRYDVSAFGEDYDEKFFASEGLVRLQRWFNSHQSECPVVPDEERLGPPMCRPSKIICIGLNYAKHAAESGMEVPSEPVLFFKATTAFCGPNDNVVIPRHSKKTDWEVELAVVIGQRASYIEKEDAMDYIAGYCLHNDYSEREFQIERGGQWVKGKSADTFAPTGPFLATKDEISDPHNLHLWLDLNGQRLQDSNTNDLIFDIPTSIAYISQFMTLLPGDMISTGTPAGVGLGLKPQRYLVPGDVVTLGIEGLGQSTQRAVACP
ncbi:MAG: fumarylacetoacetate hydrolase family protein [Saprospiraceae bacterium]|nr:fumarylacetoacetate hydrolase family protein [Saprospiraceae bacterium]